MPGPVSELVCAGCGTRPSAAPAAPPVFRCPRAGSGDDVDHVLQRVLDPAWAAYPRGAEPNPFVRYRTLMRAHHVALAGGLSDSTYTKRVEDLDRAVAAVDGHGFTVTPAASADALAARLGLAA